MEADPIIRPAAPGDAEDLARLAREGFEETFPFDWERNAKGLLEGAASGKVTVLVAEAGGACVGYVNLRPWLEGGWIDQVAVDARRWRKGVASRLVAAALASARERRMLHVATLVQERDGRAEAFWRRNGWKPVGRVEGALGEHGDGLLLNRRV